MADRRLLEDGSRRLLEDGSYRLQEQQSTIELSATVTEDDDMLSAAVHAAQAVGGRVRRTPVQPWAPVPREIHIAATLAEDDDVCTARVDVQHGRTVIRRRRVAHTLLLH